MVRQVRNTRSPLTSSELDLAILMQRYDCADDRPPADCAATCTNPHFWHISTAAHIDWPQQSRMIELVNVNGKMSLVLTMLDHLGPANPGGPTSRPTGARRRTRCRGWPRSRARSRTTTTEATAAPAARARTAT